MKKKIMFITILAMLFGCLPAVYGSAPMAEENEIYSESIEESSEEAEKSSGFLSYRLIGGAVVLVVLMAINSKNRMKEKQMYLQ